MVTPHPTLRKAARRTELPLPVNQKKENDAFGQSGGLASADPQFFPPLSTVTFGGREAPLRELPDHSCAPWRPGRGHSGWLRVLRKGIFATGPLGKFYIFTVGNCEQTRHYVTSSSRPHQKEESLSFRLATFLANLLLHGINPRSPGLGSTLGCLVYDHCLHQRKFPGRHSAFPLWKKHKQNSNLQQKLRNFRRQKERKGRERLGTGGAERDRKRSGTGGARRVSPGTQACRAGSGKPRSARLERGPQGRRAATTSVGRRRPRPAAGAELGGSLQGRGRESGRMGGERRSPPGSGGDPRGSGRAGAAWRH